MKTKILLTLLCVCILALGFAGIDTTTVYAAESGTCGDNLTWTLDDNGVLTISGTGAMTNYSRVSKIENLSMNYYTDAPWGTNIKSVVIESGVTSIGNCAFTGCANLVSVDIPATVTSIGEYAFEECDGLISFVIPDTVTSVGDCAFIRCYGLTTVTISNGLTSLGQFVFGHCRELTTATIPNSVKTLDDYAFYYCKKLTAVTIPSSVTSIGNYAFAGSGVTLATFYGNAPTMGTNVFEDVPADLKLVVSVSATGYDNDTWSAYTIEETCFHSWNTAWSTDDTYHWHDCANADCIITENSGKDGYAEHNFDPTTHECTCGANNHIFDENHTCTCGAIAVNEHTFPDEIFRNHILGKPYGTDGVLTPLEIAGVELISVRNKDITDLTGIEYFTAITMLDATGNNLTSLDISRNKELSIVGVSRNQLTRIDVSENKKLTQLVIANNQLKSLDVIANTLLTILDCSGNYLTSLDVSNHTALTKLYCQNNYLTSLDLSANTLITTFDGSGQMVEITVLPDLNIYNMSALDSRFDGAKATASTSGVSFSGNLLVLPNNTSAASYLYATGLTDRDLDVTLTVQYAEQTAAREVEFRKGTDYIQWRYVGEDDNAWKNLIAISELTGADGTNGEDGEDGENGEKGDKGDSGAAGTNGTDGVTPHIGENGNWWFGETDTGIRASGENGKDGKDGEDGKNGKDGVTTVATVSMVVGSVALLGNVGWGAFFLGKKKRWF